MNKRVSSIELLRILAILGIITLHYLNENIGGVFSSIKQGTANIYLAYVIKSAVIISVNVFVLISGYFNLEKESFRPIKAINLYIIMVFYALLFYTIMITVGAIDFSPNDLLYKFFPFLIGRQWFVEVYIMLMLFSPFINFVLRELSIKSYIILLCIIVLLYSIWPSFFPNAPTNDAGYGLLHFITMYSIGGFFKRFIDNSIIRTVQKRSLFITIYIVSVGLSLGGLKILHTGWNYDYFFNITGACAVFLFFLSLNLKRRHSINFIASLCFGIYLTHADYSIQDLVYRKILRTEYYCNTNFFIVHIIASVVSIFTVSALIEMLRKKIWSLTVDKWLGKTKLANIEIKVK